MSPCLAAWAAGRVTAPTHWTPWARARRTRVRRGTSGEVVTSAPGACRATPRLRLSLLGFSLCARADGRSGASLRGIASRRCPVGRQGQRPREVEGRGRRKRVVTRRGCGRGSATEHTDRRAGTDQAPMANNQQFSNPRPARGGGPRPGGQPRPQGAAANQQMQMNMPRGTLPQLAEILWPPLTSALACGLCGALDLPLAPPHSQDPCLNEVPDRR